MKVSYKTILMTLSVSLILIPAASAQRPKGITACFEITSNCTGPDGAKTCTLQRNIGTSGSMAPSCVTAAQVNASCSIAVSGFVLTFKAVQTGASPSCHWSCSACPAVTMNTSTGLPVELLGFDVEDGDATGLSESEDDGDGRNDESE